VAIAEYGEVPRDAAPTTMVLSYDADAAEKQAPATVLDQPAIPAQPAADIGTAAAAVETAGEEAALVAGLPTGALVAVGLVVAAVVAILVFGG
jgi:hypothetical protein